MMMEKIRLFAKTFAAAVKYNRYLNTGSHRCLMAAERLAHRVGEMDAGNRVPLLFMGKPNLEREWASGKGNEFFFNWLVSHGRKPGTFNQLA